jgi:hypothetical protein
MEWVHMDDGIWLEYTVSLNDRHKNGLPLVDNNNTKHQITNRPRHAGFMTRRG